VYKMLQIARFRLKQMLKVPATLITLFVMPIMFSLIFGSFALEGNQAPPRVAVVVEDCELCDELSKLLTNNDAYEWVALSEEEARLQVQDRSTLAAVVVESDAYELLEASQSPYRVIVNQKTDAYIVFSQFISGLSSTIYAQAEQVKELGAEGLKQVLAHMNSQLYVKLEQQSYNSFVLKGEQHAKAVSKSTRGVGFTIMFLMFTLGSAASIIHKERKDYTWQRLRTTAATFPQIIAGYLGSFWLLGWLQFAVMISFMYVMYGVSWGSYLVPFVSLMIIMIVAFSLMMATLFKSQKQAEALNSIIIVSTCMLGGVYWPLEIVPDAMQKIAYVIPQYWMMEGMEYVMMNEQNWSIMWQAWIILSFYSIIFLWIAIRNLSKEQ